MKNKKLILGIIALAVLIAVFVGVYLATRPQTQQGAKTITVEVVHKDGETKTFTYRTDEEYLGKVLLAEELVVMDESGMISTVDGEEAKWEPDQAYWSFYVGKEYAAMGVNDTPVADGDTFRLVYTTGNFEE